MTTISDQTIYITGGTSGIGLATAIGLVERGAHVLLMSRKLDADALATVVARRASTQQRVAHVIVDVADRDAVLSVFSKAQEEFGAPDVLINCAGIGSARAFTKMEFSEFDRVMRVNLYGSRNVVEAVLPAMIRRGGGKIVIVGSMASFVPVYGYTAYGTSKFAVLGFAQCLRYELKPLGIGVACFCPGEVETRGLAEEALVVHPAGRAMKNIGGRIGAPVAARVLIKGIERDKFLIVPSARNRLVYWLQRLTPSAIWNFITDAIIAHALQREARASRSA